MSELYHHGIKGMKWGVRRHQNKSGHTSSSRKRRHSHTEKKTIRKAKKDAKEYATAKMYYGEGAGTRRKLIKNQVAERSKDSLYKKTFEKELSNQSMSKAVDRAKSQRRRTDVKNTTTKTARGLINFANGNAARAGATAVAIGSAAVIIHRTGADKIVAQYAKRKLADLTYQDVDFNDVLRGVL